MKNSLHRSSFLVFFILIYHGLFAQDPEFSQYYATTIYTNPASTGSDFSRAALAYRVQYYGLPGGFVTFNASYDQHVKKLRGGLGIMFTNDKAGEGILTSNSIYLSYSYEHEITKKIILRIGVQSGIFQKALQWDKLRWGDQILSQLGYLGTTNETRIDKAITRANFAAGAMVYSKKFYAGIACHNLLEPNQSFFAYAGPGTILPRRVTLHGGMLIPLDGKEDSKINISPNILLMMQGKFNQMNIGFYANKGAMVAGFWFRTTTPNADAVIGMIGVRKNHFKFGFTTDFTISNLKSAGKTAFEFTTIYEFKNKAQKKEEPRIRCPLY